MPAGSQMGPPVCSFHNPCVGSHRASVFIVDAPRPWAAVDTPSESRPEAAIKPPHHEQQTASLHLQIATRAEQLLHLYCSKLLVSCPELTSSTPLGCRSELAMRHH